MASVRSPAPTAGQNHDRFGSSTTELPLRSNALSNKLTSMLSTSYADLDVRDALDILDQRGIDNTPETRRQLRLDVQKEVIDCNGEIIREFGQVAAQLERVGSAVASLNRYCDEMRQHISSAQAETDPVIAEASSLITQRDHADVKQQILRAFNQHFIVSEDDQQTLTSAAEPVDDHFFAVVTKMKKIYRDCQVLLGTEEQKLGLEIMEQSSRTLNGAFQKLYQWIQKQFKTLDLENPQISSSIRRALRVLAERPSLFQGCLDSFAAARELILSDAFHAALTGSSESEGVTLTKPIEFHAHDPLRYIGDMLAWVHSTTVSEREVLEAFFVSEGDEIAKGIQAGLDGDPWSRSGDADENVFDGVKALNDLVDRDLEGVARSLRQRVDQVIQSHDDFTLAYRIANLIKFYRSTFAKLLGQGSTLADALTTLEQSALRQFRATMRDHVRAVESDLSPPPTNLSMPGFLDDALQQLKVLMKSYDISLVPDSERASDFEPILAEALEPFLRCCEVLAKDLEEPADSIFVLNCLSAVTSTLVAFAFTGDQVEENQETLNEHRSKLTDFQHAFFLHTSGLHPLLTALAPLTDSDGDLRSIPSLPAFRPTSLIKSSQTLDDFLPSALLDATENLKQLKDLRLAQEITEEAANRFGKDFEFVQAKLDAADELLEDTESEEDSPEERQSLREMFPRTSGEIRVLLS